MLSHFYGFLLFTNPVIDNYFKRFVRDFLHYTDSIYCAAGKIVNALQEEGKALGFEEDEEGGGGHCSHIGKSYVVVTIDGSRVVNFILRDKD